MRDDWMGTEVVLSHTDAPGDVEKFYEQWQVFFGYYNAVFFGMDGWSGNALQRLRGVGNLMTDAPLASVLNG